MRNAIQSIDFVSDGILVHFHGGLRCYFPANFLLDHVHDQENHVFLDYDPSPQMREASAALVEELAPSMTDRAVTVC